MKVHVHDPIIRKRRRRPRGHRVEKRHRRVVKDNTKRWIDLDKNILDDCIPIDDKNLGPSIFEINGGEAPYFDNLTEYDDDDDDDNGDDNEDDDNDEDSGSHDRRESSIYMRSKRSTLRRYPSDFDFGQSYPLANSHENAYQDSSSHGKYTELYPEYCAKSSSNLNMNRRDLDAPSCSVANSHGEYDGLATDISGRGCRDSSEGNNLPWSIRLGTNYEIANSHSNYCVFYDSQAQHRGVIPPRASELWSENHYGGSRIISRDTDVAKERDKDEHEANNDQSGKGFENEENSETTCDIEQCLVQIEESLLNIEQNLLHVQDLDIPELRNLLYKSPSIERSLFEVQDLLYADGIVPVISRKSIFFDSEEEEEEEDEEEEGQEKEAWIKNMTNKKNNEEDEGVPLLNSSNEESSDTTNVDEHNLLRSADNHYTNLVDSLSVPREKEKDLSVETCSEKMINFVPNSLGKTLSRKIVLDEVRENIKLYSSEPEESMITIDYNLNTACAEKNSFFRDKWYSRTNSLDENSIFQGPEFGDKQRNGKFSLQDIFFESGSLAINAKACSEGMLPANQNKLLKRNRRRSHEELPQTRRTTTENFRILEDFTSQQRSILNRQKKITSKFAKEAPSNAVPESKEKSPAKPKRSCTTSTRSQNKDSSAGKNTECDKRKKKKAFAKSHDASENAMVSSKLISLSLSLLLAALLQAVRCLTDLVEDAFKSISYDRNGLLQ